MSTLFISYVGVLEAIRISCAGYPTYKSFADFVSRFWPSSSTCFAGETDSEQGGDAGVSGNKVLLGLFPSNGRFS
ncbi:hypothetical protein Tco_0995676 [Tanacetum coccineum]|uniref:Uncharacterized protein n=1 Tax=Tanacetum coccineum TaxID=301880 RepID=A0ABQ5J539_9ASTR